MNLYRLWYKATNLNTYAHDFPIYLKRIGYALVGKDYKALCCYTWSLDYSVMRELVDWLEYLIPKTLEQHVWKAKDKRELNELLELAKVYVEDWPDFNLDWESYKDIKKYGTAREKKWNRYCDLYKTYYRKLRL